VHLAYGRINWCDLLWSCPCIVILSRPLYCLRRAVSARQLNTGCSTEPVMCLRMPSELLMCRALQGKALTTKQPGQVNGECNVD
jgi:hypothetical protein